MGGSAACAINGTRAAAPLIKLMNGPSCADGLACSIEAILCPAFECSPNCRSRLDFSPSAPKTNLPTRPHNDLRGMRVPLTRVTVLGGLTCGLPAVAYRQGSPKNQLRRLS